jgi:hypothetical protein
MTSFADALASEANQTEPTDNGTPDVQSTAPPAEPTGDQETSSSAEPEPQQSPDAPEGFAKRIKGLETALSETRKERQRAQERLAYLEGRIASDPKNQDQPTDPQLTEEDFWTDPMAVQEKMIAKHMETVRSEFNVRMVKASAVRMRKTHDDFDDTMKHFFEAQKNNPHLENAAFESGDPVGWAYDWVKEQQRIQELGGNPDKLREQIRAEERAKIEAELKGSAAAKGFPTTQAGARTSGPTAAGGGQANMDPFANKGY